MSKFHFLTGDINFTLYGGKWYRKVSGTCYHVIELINMWEATGEEDQNKYHVSLAEIELQNIPTHEIESAWASCGWDESRKPENALQVVEAVHDYGCYAPMGNYNGNNYKNLLKQAKEESYLLDNSDYHSQQLNRPVNMLGSTALEYSQGDFQSAMLRGIFSGNVAARIVGKMHGLKEDDLNTLQSTTKEERDALLRGLKHE